MHIDTVQKLIMSFSPRPEAAKRLADARQKRGFRTAKAAADFFGWKYATYAQHEEGVRGLHRAASRYAKAFRVSEAWLLTGYGGDELEQTKEIFGGVPVVGEVSAGTWFDVDGDGAFEDHPPVPALSGYPLDWQRAYVVSGTSINLKARPGEILVCVDLAASGVSLAHDDLVIVERERDGGLMRERTAKLARKTAQGWELWPASDDPKWQSAIPLSGDEVRVVAKVLWVTRRV